MNVTNQKMPYVPPQVEVWRMPTALNLLMNLSSESEGVWDYGEELSDVENYGSEP